MRVNKLNKSIEESREQERIAAGNEKYQYLFEYIAMMTDVELPEDSATETGNMGGGEDE